MHLLLYLLEWCSCTGVVASASSSTSGSQQVVVLGPSYRSRRARQSISSQSLAASNAWRFAVARNWRWSISTRRWRTLHPVVNATQPLQPLVMLATWSCRCCRQSIVVESYHQYATPTCLRVSHTSCRMSTLNTEYHIKSFCIHWYYWGVTVEVQSWRVITIFQPWVH